MAINIRLLTESSEFVPNSVFGNCFGGFAGIALLSHDIRAPHSASLIGLSASRPQFRELMVRILSYYLAVIALVILIPFSLFPQNSRKPSRTSPSIAAIRAVLDAQRDAWNRGDIEGYMDGYDRSTDTVFISGDNVTRGWQTVLERYKKNYDTREKMGVLTFSDLEIIFLVKLLPLFSVAGC